MQTVSVISIGRRGWLNFSFTRISLILPIFLSLWSINVAAKALVVVEASVVLEGGPSKRQHLQEVGREDSEWGRRTTEGVLSEDIDVRASLQPMFHCLRLLHEQRPGLESVS